MKNKLLLSIFVLGSYSAYSQASIGAKVPNQSSQLEIVANNKGVLIPRIILESTTDMTTITNGNVSSLLVFNTAAAGDVKPGYYYWYDNKWNRIVVEDEIDANIGTVTYNSETKAFSYVDKSGDTQIINISEIIKSNQTVTTFTDNTKGVYVYKNESGDEVTIDIPGSLSENFQMITENPAVTTILNNIIKKAEGNVAYNSETKEFSYVDKSGNTQVIVLTDNNTTYTAASPGIILQGTEFSVPNTIAQWNSNQLQGKEIVSTPPSNDQVLTFNGTNWEPAHIDVAKLYKAGDGIIIKDANISTLEPWKNIATGIGATDNTQDIYQMGSVGIGGVNDLSYKLKVYGSISATNFTQTSDKRYKKDVVPITEALNKVLQIQGVGYNWKSDEFKDKNFDDKHQLGVLAQDVLKIIPEAVSKDDKGYYTVNYITLIPVLIEAVKEQQNSIKYQEVKNESLQIQINELRTMINNRKIEK